MTGWDVRVGEVRGVILRTAAAAKPLRAHAKSLGTELNQAYGAVQIGIMASALQGFADHVATVLPDVADEINSVLNGAVTATKAYIEGDQHMALEAERGVSRAVGLQQPDHRISPRADGK